MTHCAASHALLAQQVAEARAGGALFPPNHPYAQVVRRVGMQVARVASDGQGGGRTDHMRVRAAHGAERAPPQHLTPVELPQRPGEGHRARLVLLLLQGLDWEFAVVKNPVPNAFVVPGGKVVVFSGLLDLLSSEDELAAVLAHETAHVLARHHVRAKARRPPCYRRTSSGCPLLTVRWQCR